MANVTKARAGHLIRTLFEILIAHPDGIRAVEALGALEKRVTLTDFEAGDYDSGGRRFERLVRFGTVSSVKAGWMTKQKGIWSITDEGKAAFETYSDGEKFFREAEKLYRTWRKAQPDAVDGETSSTTPLSPACTMRGWMACLATVMPRRS